MTLSTRRINGVMLAIIARLEPLNLIHLATPLEKEIDVLLVITVLKIHLSLRLVYQELSRRDTVLTNAKLVLLAITAQEGQLNHWNVFLATVL